MKTTETGRKFTGIYRGSLESAGLGELAYFLKKAKSQIDNARFTLDNTDFSRSLEILKNATEKISAIDRLIVDMRNDLEMAEQAALISMEEKETRETEESEEKAKEAEREKQKKWHSKSLDHQKR